VPHGAHLYQIGFLVVREVDVVADFGKRRRRTFASRLLA